jgi:hypothetical protein
MIHNSFNRYYSDEKLNSQVRKKKPNKQTKKQTNKQTKKYKTKKQR